MAKMQYQVLRNEKIKHFSVVSDFLRRGQFLPLNETFDDESNIVFFAKQLSLQKKWLLKEELYPNIVSDTNFIVDDVSIIRENLFTSSGDLNISFENDEERKEFFDYLTNLIKLYKFPQEIQKEFGTETSKYFPNYKLFNTPPEETTKILEELHRASELVALECHADSKEGAAIKEAAAKLKEKKDQATKPAPDQTKQPADTQPQKKSEESTSKPLPKWLRFLILAAVFIYTLGMYPLWKYKQTQKDRKAVRNFNAMVDGPAKDTVKKRIPDDYFERAKFSEYENFLIKAHMGLHMRCDSTRPLTGAMQDGMNATETLRSVPKARG